MKWVLGLLLLWGTGVFARPIACPIALTDPYLKPFVGVRELTELRTATINMENFEWARKSHEQRIELARAILDQRLDIVAVQEVFTALTMEKFNDEYLGGLFRVFLLPGNDQFKNVGFLVRKALPFTYEYRSFSREMWNDPIRNRVARVFSRDVPALIIRLRGSTKPLLVYLGVHYKAKHSRVGDPDSFVLRQAQIDRTEDIIKRLRREFGDDVNLVVTGDANARVEEDRELFGLRDNAKLEDALMISPNPVKLEDRYTLTFNKGLGVQREQVDVYLVSRSLYAMLKDVWVHRYPGVAPSDHDPYIVILDFQKLIR